MSNIFFSGCTHFGHANIIKLCKRPFNSVEEMDEKLIENWNRVVKRGDTVYHHGDFAYKGKASHDSYLSRLNGNILLIRGNHDPEHWGQSYRELKINKQLIVMMHYPIEEWNGYFRGAIHTHCHTHKPDLISAKQRFNVGVDSCNYTPISLDEILSHV